MKIAIPITYEKGYFESNFLFPDGSICLMDDLAYIYSNGNRFLCVTNVGIYNDGQSSSRTKHIKVYNDDLSLADMNQQYFAMVETEQEPA